MGAGSSVRSSLPYQCWPTYALMQFSARYSLSNQFDTLAAEHVGGALHCSCTDGEREKDTGLLGFSWTPTSSAVALAIWSCPDLIRLSINVCRTLACQESFNRDRLECFWEKNSKSFLVYLPPPLCLHLAPSLSSASRACYCY